jgi:cyclase
MLLHNHRLVKSKNFSNIILVGNINRTAKVYNDTDADELIVLNIDRNNRSIDSVDNCLESLSKNVFIPLSVGGGINSVLHAEKIIRGGSDKVIINTILYQDYEIIKKISQKFGNQAVIASIDSKYNVKKNTYELFSDCGQKKENVTLEEHIYSCIKNGAGEIMINSIDQDGMMKGLDINLIKIVTKISTIPVIAAGGVGNFNHLKEAFLETKISAVACGSIFNFGDNNPVRAKAYLSNYNIPFREID